MILSLSKGFVTMVSKCQSRSHSKWVNHTPDIIAVTASRDDPPKIRLGMWCVCALYIVYLTLYITLVPSFNQHHNATCLYMKVFSWENQRLAEGFQWQWLFFSGCIYTSDHKNSILYIKVVCGKSWKYK